MYFLVYIPSLISFGALAWAVHLLLRTRHRRFLHLILPGTTILVVSLYSGYMAKSPFYGPLFQTNLMFSFVWAGAVIFIGQSIALLAAAERRFAAGESRAEVFRNSVVDGVILIDSKGIIQSANPAAERLFGYDASEIVGLNVNLLMPEPYRSNHDGYLSRFLETGEARIIGAGREVEGRRKDGGTFPIYLSVSQYYMDGKRFFTGIVHDLSELHQERNFISAVLNVAGALVVVLDREGRIVRFNRACARATGYTLQDVRDKRLWDVLIPPENAREIERVFFQIRDGEYPHEYENEWLTREGERLLIEWANTALADEHGRVEYVIATGIDITAKREAELENRRLSRGIIEVQEEERNRIAREIHDTLGQSLIALKFQIQDIGYRNADNEDLRLDCERVTSYVNDIARESRELSHSLSPISMRRLGLPEAIREMARTFESGHGIRVDVKLDELTDFFEDDWNTDAYRMVQEALINACRHSGARGIEILGSREEGGMTVRVRDDGNGLEDPREGGAGLGLRIMRERASFLGAGFRLKSRKGEGTEVVFEFPG